MKVNLAEWPMDIYLPADRQSFMDSWLLADILVHLAVLLVDVNFLADMRSPIHIQLLADMKVEVKRSSIRKIFRRAILGYALGLGPFFILDLRRRSNTDLIFSIQQLLTQTSTCSNQRCTRQFKTRPIVAG